MKAIQRRRAVLLSTVLGAALGCGSTAPKPTLPAPEFEPPEILPWDAGNQAASDSAFPSVGADLPAADPDKPLPVPGPPAADAGPAAAATSGLPLAEPSTKVNIEPGP